MSDESTSQIARLDEANRRFAGSFDAGDLEISPARPLIVLDCIDARVDPATAFGLALGDAHVVRNAGVAPRTTRSGRS